MLEEVRRGLWQKILAMDKAELWYLETGKFFLQGVFMAAFIATTRWTQEINGAMGVKWRRVLQTDGASLQDRDTYIMEAWGIPIGYRNRPALEALIKTFGMIRWVVSDGLIEEDLNISLVEAEGPMGSTPPALIRLQGPQGTFGIRLSTGLPPPPLAVQLKLAAAEDSNENDLAVSDAELTAEESSGQQKQRTSPAKIEQKGKQQLL